MPPDSKLLQALDPCLSHIAVIATTLETRDSYPGEEQLAQELESVIVPARKQLTELLGTVSTRLMLGQNDIGLEEVTALKEELIRLEVLVRSPEDAIRYGFPEDMTFAKLALTGPYALASYVINDLSARLHSLDTFLDRQAFERAIKKRFQALLFALYCIHGAPRR